MTILNIDTSYRITAQEDIRTEETKPAPSQEHSSFLTHFSSFPQKIPRISRLPYLKNPQEILYKNLIFQAVQTVRNSRNNPEKMETLFVTTLNNLREFSYKTALFSGKNLNDGYGKLRTINPSPWATTLVHLQANTAAISFITKELAPLLNKLGNFRGQMKRTLQQGNLNSRNFSTEINIINKNNHDNFVFSAENDANNLDTVLSHLPENNQAATIIKMLLNGEIYEKVYKTSTKTYNKIRNLFIIRQIQQEFPRPGKTSWVISRNIIGSDLNKYVLSEKITWLYHDPQKEQYTLDSISKCSRVIVLHTDAHHLDNAIKDISHFFNKAIQWHSEEKITGLKDSVAALIYLLTQVKFLEKSNTAFAVQMEEIIYRTHYFSVSHPEDTTVFSDALAYPINEFIACYHEQTELTIIQPIEQNPIYAGEDQ